MTAEHALQAPPRVFISYAHASDEHVEVVRTLWILLCRLGIDAQLDRVAAQRRQDWPLWMMQQVREADFVLLIASQDYAKRSEGRAEAGEGLGVRFEAALIRDAAYADPKGALQRFLPVLVPGESVAGIPAFMYPNTTTHYRVVTVDQSGVTPLLRVLTDQPEEVQPQIGPIPHLPARGHGVAPAVAPLTHAITLDVSCADGRVRCRTELAGTTLGEHEADPPPGGVAVWDALRRRRAAADQQLAEAGHRLRDVLFDGATIGRLTELADRSGVRHRGRYRAARRSRGARPAVRAPAPDRWPPAVHPPGRPLSPPRLGSRARRRRTAAGPAEDPRRGQRA